MTELPRILKQLPPDSGDAVLVTVAAAEGSTPREAGTAMLVTRSRIFGSIGGGHLEFKAIEAAREMSEGHRLVRFPLGPALGQCCGGSASLLFEAVPARQAGGAWWRALDALQDITTPGILVTAAGPGRQSRKLLVFRDSLVGSLEDEGLQRKIVARARLMLRQGATATQADLEEHGEAGLLVYQPVQPGDFDIVLFGAGHVGRALVKVLSDLPCRITWIDSREEAFPETLADNVRTEVSPAPEYDVDEAPRGSYFLVMTHSHQLDLRLSERILKRGDFRYFGLIGSRSKRRRFEKRLRQRGIADDRLNRMVCPIGAAGISGKHPAEISIAVAAQILQLRDAETRQSGAEPAATTLSA